jgi:DNA-binding IclR family transcriptional regulator
MDDKKLNILRTLGKDREMFTLEIAKDAGISAATTCKYLEVLKAEGKVTSNRRAPFTYWKRTATRV